MLRWLGHEDAARLARQAEAVLSGSTPKAEDAAPAREPTRAVGVPLRSVAFADEARGVLLDLWREVADTANKLLGPELTALHGNPKERLNAREVPALWRCPGCGEGLARGARLHCPTCDRPARLAAGDEIVLERIELEVPDV